MQGACVATPHSEPHVYTVPSCTAATLIREYITMNYSMASWHSLSSFLSMLSFSFSSMASICDYIPTHLGIPTGYRLPWKQFWVMLRSSGHDATSWERASQTELAMSQTTRWDLPWLAVWGRGRVNRPSCTAVRAEPTARPRARSLIFEPLASVCLVVM